MWTTALQAAGVEVLAVSHRSVHLGFQGLSRDFELVRRGRAPFLNEVKPAPARPSLLVAPSVSPSVGERLEDRGWSWADDAGAFCVRFSPRVVAFSQGTGTGPESSVRSDGVGLPEIRLRRVTGFAVLRRLIELTAAAPERKITQADVARASGQEQSRVSRVLSSLRASGVVTGGYGTWYPLDPSTAIKAWLAHYPGPGGVNTHWAGLGDVWTATVAALDELGPGVVVSGDVGADLVASWRSPRRAVVYAESAHDLSAAGLLPVPVDQAQVVVCVPEDRTVWPLHPLERSFRGRSVQVADPLQVWWDARQATDVDAGESAERVRDWVYDVLRVTA
jgi:hypothetical protein